MSTKVQEQLFRNLTDVVVDQVDQIRVEMNGLKNLINNAMEKLLKLSDIPEDFAFDPNKTYSYDDFRAKVVETSSKLWNSRFTIFNSNVPIR